MDMYAVIKTGGKQHRVSEGELLTVEKLAGSKGDSVVFDDVLMVAKEGEIRVWESLSWRALQLSVKLSPR
jgi:large subunit ribosomal protein L21